MSVLTHNKAGILKLRTWFKFAVHCEVYNLSEQMKDKRVTLVKTVSNSGNPKARTLEQTHYYFNKPYIKTESRT